MMGDFSIEYLERAEIWLFSSTLLYFLMNGAQIFETLVFVPKWAATPPQSLHLLADRNGVSLKSFWIGLHSLHEITFFLALAFCWQIDCIRDWLILLLVLHFALRAWTILYFAPQIMRFEREALGEDSIDLRRRAIRWQRLNYFRVAVYLLISLAFLPLCAEIWQLARN